jgi:DHA1 family tetracycline resistance protein-like MFS transporter
VGLVYASTTVVWTSYSLLAVVLPFRFEALGFSVVQYGVAVGTFALGMLATESLWGLLAFRIGRSRLILALGAATALLYLAVGVLTDYSGLLLALGLLGALIVFPVPLFRWMAMMARGPGTEGSGTGRYTLFFMSGMVVGSALGPLVYVTEGFGALMECVLAMYVAGVALMTLLPWNTTHLPPVERGSLSLVRRVLTAPFLFVSGLVVLDYLAYTLVVNFLQIYSVANFHGTPTDAGYVIGASRATLLVAGWWLGSVVDRFGALRSVPLGFLVLASGAFGTLVSTSYGEMVLATLVFSVGAGWLAASLLPLALGPIAAPLQGTAIGVFGSFEDLGLLIGPVLLSAVYATDGAPSMFEMVGGIATAAGLISLLYPLVVRHSARAAPEAATVTFSSTSK